jgi:hypothetical protein
MASQINLMWITITAMLVIGSGCAGTRSASKTMTSLLPARSDTRAQHLREWNDWADTHLQNGDIVFMRGDCLMLLGTVNFSELSTDLTASRFSHIGIVSTEEGQTYVYDIRSKGCIRTRFGELLADRDLHQFAIKRHRDLTPEALAEVAAFGQGVYRRREKYDDQLKLDNDRLYCSELVEKSYQQVGVKLSDSIAIQDLPNYDRHLQAIKFVRAITSIEPDQEVLVPGNEQIGIWANPALDLVLDCPDTKALPPR